ncbi:ROK family protein [Chitiniphilus shinanonensis]|uniref:ROK family protein n=1 Tax=Chitiniphilus shinanonensis TaxID=553088 RepID=UPI000361EBFD|nr:ROK family protein [Chitiniphilus shinanonensis]
MNLLTFDIGGTHIKYGFVSDTGVVGDTWVADTEGKRGAEFVLNRLLELAAPLVEARRPDGIAVSSLGLIDPLTGFVTAAAEAIPDYVGTSPLQVLADAFNLPVAVENDVNCVALAEGWRGAAQGVGNYIALTVGTGIGGGIVIDHRLYRGHRAAAGEWGYMRIADKLWEDHASMRGLIDAARAATGQTLDGRAIFAAHDGGDPVLRQVVDDWLTLLATGIANLIYALNPQRVVIGGGIASRGQRFHDEIESRINECLLPDFRDMSEIALATAGNHAGMIGAVRNWLTAKRLF